MAKAAQSEAQLESTNPEVKKPRLTKLIIKSCRAIGDKAVEIELNDIVILVGLNYVGNRYLKAYELAISQGPNKAMSQLDDFPNGKIDEPKLPEIELHTVVYDDEVGVKWIDEVDGEKVVKERWAWREAGAPKRTGLDTTLNEGAGG